MDTPPPTYRFYDAPLIPSTTRFHHTIDRSSHIAELTAIEVQTTVPPLDILLEELGSLRISIGGILIHNIPIPLLCALNTPTYTGNRLTIPCDFRMFIGRFLLLDPQPVVISLETLTTTNISNVRFMLRRTLCDTTERHLLAYGDHNHTIQQVQTQTLQVPPPEPTQHFTFYPSMAQFTKGFFIEGTVQDISSVRLTMTGRPGGELWMYYAGELSVLARPVTDRYLFVPFNHLADMRSTTSDSYIGAFAYRGSIELTVTYNVPRRRATIHSLVSNTLKYRAGVLQHERGSQWSRLVKALNPERSTCPITYEQITGDYCECDTCHYAFDATSLQNFVTGKPDPTCPTCRSSWTSRVVYQQANL